MGEHQHICGVCGRVPGEPHALLCTSGKEFQRRAKAWGEKRTRHRTLKWPSTDVRVSKDEVVKGRGTYVKPGPKKLPRKQRKAKQRAEKKARERASQLAPGLAPAGSHPAES